MSNVYGESYSKDCYSIDRSLALIEALSNPRFLYAYAVQGRVGNPNNLLTTSNQRQVIGRTFCGLDPGWELVDVISRVELRHNNSALEDCVSSKTEIHHGSDNCPHEIGDNLKECEILKHERVYLNHITRVATHAAPNESVMPNYVDWLSNNYPWLESFFRRPQVRNALTWQTKRSQPSMHIDDSNTEDEVESQHRTILYSVELMCRVHRDICSYEGSQNPSNPKLLLRSRWCANETDALLSLKIVTAHTCQTRCDQPGVLFDKNAIPYFVQAIKYEASESNSFHSSGKYIHREVIDPFSIGSKHAEASKDLSERLQNQISSLPLSNCQHFISEIKEERPFSSNVQLYQETGVSDEKLAIPLMASNVDLNKSILEKEMSSFQPCKSRRIMTRQMKRILDEHEGTSVINEADNKGATRCGRETREKAKYQRTD